MATFTNETRNSAVLSNEAKNTGSFANETKGGTYTGTSGTPYGLLLSLTQTAVFTATAFTNENKN